MWKLEKSTSKERWYNKSIIRIVIIELKNRGLIVSYRGLIFGYIQCKTRITKPIRLINKSSKRTHSEK